MRATILDTQKNLSIFNDIRLDYNTQLQKDVSIVFASFFSVLTSNPGIKAEMLLSHACILHVSEPKTRLNVFYTLWHMSTAV